MFKSIAVKYSVHRCYVKDPSRVYSKYCRVNDSCCLVHHKSFLFILEGTLHIIALMVCQFKASGIKSIQLFNMHEMFPGLYTNMCWSVLWHDIKWKHFLTMTHSLCIRSIKTWIYLLCMVMFKGIVYPEWKIIYSTSF